MPKVGIAFFLALSTYSDKDSITLAGPPPTTELAGTLWVTTTPHAITELSPITTPGIIIALVPI